MKIKISRMILLVALIFIAAELSIWVNPVLAQQNLTQSSCLSCHGAVEPTLALKDCMGCHSGHDGQVPQTTDPDTVHRIHLSAGAKIGSGRKFCLTCHKVPDCSNCHNSHPSLSRTDCATCHEGLPNPKGHGDTRALLQTGKHAWMNSCLTCHSKETGKLQFSTITTDMKNSTDLCRICHPIEYRNMMGGTHGKAGSTKCVNCHDPHLANIMGEIKASSQTASNQSLFETIEKLVEGIPMIKNPLVLIILIIIAIAAGSEYFLTRKEKAKVVMTDLIKIEGDAGAVRAMEIGLANEDYVNDLLNLLKEKNIGILGMSLQSTSKIKLVLFLDFSKANVSQDALLNLIKDLKEAVVYAEYTEKYEF